MNNKHKEKYAQISQKLLDLLEAKRKEQNLSCQNVADKIGFSSQQSVADMLSGKFAIRLPDFLALLEALGGNIILDFPEKSPE